MKFYHELESALSTSTEEQRKLWAQTIIEENIDLKDLFNLLLCEKKVATRFLWLLGRIAMTKPKTLFDALPSLLHFCENLDPLYKTSFANYWLLAGVPIENESQAIDWCFHWLLSADTNVTIKSRALFVLAKLTRKYPELKNELTLCLKDQMDKYSKDFHKRAVKILRELNQINP